MSRTSLDSIVCIIVSAICLLLPVDLFAKDGGCKTDSLTEGISLPMIEARDTIHSAAFPQEYRVLKEQSSKNRWTKRLFRILFREASSAPKQEEPSIIDEFRPYEGKVIRNIVIKVLPPFGTNVNDTTKYDPDFKFFNNIHAQTQEATIKNIIQFKRGTTVHPAIIATSETQLRNAGYIRDARIRINSLEHTEDSVDVTIVVLDKWTIGVGLHSLSASKTNVEIFDRNILGSGSRAGINLIYSNLYDRHFGVGLNYLHQNFANKGIDIYGVYMDRIKDYDLELSARRALQPKYNYFGEINYRLQTLIPNRISWDSITPDVRSKFSATFGRAFSLSDESTIRQMVVSLRYKVKSPQYKDNVYREYIKDKLVPYKYTRNQLLLMQLSLYQNSYLREYMVYNFGNTEDIPQGYNLSMQLGYSHFSRIDNAGYASFSASYGSSEILKGSIYVSSSISSFFKGGKRFGGVFKFDSRYFTPLFQFQGFRFRQFLTVNYSRIFEPDRYFSDRIYMGEYTSLRMRNWRENKKGVEQLLVKSETDWFSKYEILGFRFLFYTFLDVGWITPKSNLFSSENFNYGVGLGIRLRNNFIVFNTIDLKIGYYPKLEQNGSNSYFKLRSDTPDIAPDFIPKVPEEIMFERD